MKTKELKGTIGKTIIEYIGMEIILGCDVFDKSDLLSQDIDLESLRSDVESYIRRTWTSKETDPNGAWSEEFLKSQLDYWCSNSYHKLVGTKEVIVNSKLQGRNNN